MFQRKQKESERMNFFRNVNLFKPQDHPNKTISNLLQQQSQNGIGTDQELITQEQPPCNCPHVDSKEDPVSAVSDTYSAYSCDSGAQDTPMGLGGMLS